MNKTFLLTANDYDAEGLMLLVIDSLDDFRMQFIEYHAKKREFLLNGVPEAYDRTLKHNRAEWLAIIERRSRLEGEFIIANNYKPLDFEFSTGCSYIKEGRGAGNFYNDVKIISDPNSKEHKCWVVTKQFVSDLPMGTHYCG